jgi:hypothetical protein
MELTADEIDRRLRERGCDSLRSYDGRAHAGMFALARHLRAAVESETRIITEDEPLVVV